MPASVAGECKFASSYEARVNGRIRMRVVVAPDKFRDSITAELAAEAIARGFVQRAGDDAEVVTIPLADGGEGTVLVLARDGELIDVETVDALGRPVSARIGMLDDCTSVVEMAEASGLWRLDPSERNPMRTSTLGSGILIASALETGARRIIVGAGGSATVDAGLGALEALGVRALNDAKNSLEPIGANLSKVAYLDTAGLDRRLVTDVSVVVACDVTAPLYGPLGAARRFASQKGANPEEVEALERGLMHIAGIYEETFGSEVAEDPGSGAAGGLAAGLLAAVDADLVDGFDLVAQITGLDSALEGADLVITGEGSFDSVSGKVTAGVTRHAHRLGIPVAVVAGQTGLSDESLKPMGIEMQLSLAELAGSVEEAKARPAEHLVTGGAQVAAWWARTGKAV